jgi:hypothetical protein
MTRHLLHTGGVVGSIPTAPTIYLIEIPKELENAWMLRFCGKRPKQTERDGNSGGKVGEDVHDLY